jgi:DNA-binding transcriptional regulator YiaG
LQQVFFRNLRQVQSQGKNQKNRAKFAGVTPDTFSHRDQVFAYIVGEVSLMKAAIRGKTDQAQQPTSPIKDIRQKLGMTQSDLALVLGCSQSYLCEVEQGRRPGMSLMDRLRALHMDADWIAGQQLQLVKWKRRQLVEKVRSGARGVG